MKNMYWYYLYVPVLFIYTFVSIDQIEKKLCTLYVGGNSDYRPKFGYSCNFKDITHMLLSCKVYLDLLTKGINYNKCKVCLN